MLNKLLFFSGLLCLLFAASAHAQQLKVVAETDAFTDYELVNNELHLLPPAGLLIPVQGNSPRYQILEQTVVSVDTVLSSDVAMVSSLSSLQTSLIEISEAGIQRGKKVAPASIHITRLGDDKTQVLKKLKIRVYKQADQVLPKAKSKALSGSELNTGDWYKIPISKNAIYQMDAEYLEELGIELSDIDPRNIQLWGTGGYLLPEANDQPRPPFTQIPITVEGQDDGSFNTNDRILFYANAPDRVTRTNGEYSHQLHPYSNNNYVFLTIGSEPGERLTALGNNSSPSRTITAFSDFIWKNEELNKAEESLKSGQ
ncbi:MAG TPA: hypothetical protein DD671_09380, partial [Balneolaceae bacterium]|nr:hypothetical protein [Balneolaceae bacterium]